MNSVIRSISESRLGLVIFTSMCYSNSKSKRYLCWQRRLDIIFDLGMELITQKVKLPEQEH